MVILYSHFQLITDCIEIISVYSSLEEAKQNHVKVLDAFVLCIIFKHSVKNFIYGTKFYRVWLPLFPTETLVNL